MSSSGYSDARYGEARVREDARVAKAAKKKADDRAEALGVVGTQSALATGSVNAAVNAARGGVSAASLVASDAAAASRAAQSAARGINNSAGQVAGAAGDMNPIIDSLRGDAATQRQTAADLASQAQPWLENSQSMLGMDATADGTTGEYWRLYGQLDPELQMSLASADARNESQAQAASAVRSLTRAGVSPSAAAIGELRTKLSNQTAALVASVKTKARQAGITMQMGVLENGIKIGMAQAGVGEAFMRDNVTATSAASGAEAAAGGLVGQQGSLYAKSGELQVTAASTGIAGVGAQIAAQNAYQNAVNNWDASLRMAGEYYSTQASSMLGLVQEGYTGDDLMAVMGRPTVSLV